MTERSQAKKTLAVTPIEGERFTFNVQASDGVEFYRVDLTSIPILIKAHSEVGDLNTFNGGCDCSHFGYRLEPLARQGAIARCKHILAVRDFYLDSIMNHYLKAEIDAVKLADRAP
jgi:hypothetical protein